jgi:dTDP-4-amino-4,6-dideoxygalactose transaminase
MSQPIHHTFAPLGDKKQRMRAVKFSYAVWKYKRGKSTKILEQELGRALGGTAFLFASGREALLALLQSLTFNPDDEVIVQSYTCVVVPNAILAAGLKPVYADIEKDTLNLDVRALEKSITHKTKAIICQHTFGIPADTKALRSICDKHNLILIEDCAHVLPDTSGPKEIGASGHYLLLSFGRDKAISGVTGGAIVSRVPHAAAELARYQEDATDLSWWHIARLIEYPTIYALARPFYGIGLGKLFLWLCGKTKLLIPIVSSREKHGRMPRNLHRMPNACAYLVLDQWRRLKEINDHRRSLTRLYMQEARDRGWPRLDGITPDLPLQKYPLFIKNAEQIRKQLKRKNIYLHDGWTGCVICPAAVNSESVGYIKSEDPKAEEVSVEILSLPTHPGMTQQQANDLCAALTPLLTHS